MARAWAEEICECSGTNYAVSESKNFLIVSALPKRLIRDTSKFLDRSLLAILKNLEGVANDSGYGMHVVFVFDTIDHYYNYISHFHGEGVHPMSGGMCITSSGYTHFAVPATDLSAFRSPLVHEMTHVLVEHLPLPIWLNEALAMRMEEEICRSPVFHIDREIYDKHAAHWNAETVQQFWSGGSWEIHGDSFELSYNLAQVLWRKLESDLRAPRSELLGFVADSNWSDGGESACQNRFGISLADLVRDFLGEGDWTPKPEMWKPKVESTSDPRTTNCRRDIPLAHDLE
ncbi:MAG: hypothetical protein MI807_10205 [Verrucomicrobiales bacterium]|nr:hypothetical protein [Verrucomicrobiales bacterium]